MSPDQYLDNSVQYDNGVILDAGSAHSPNMIGNREEEVSIIELATVQLTKMQFLNSTQSGLSD